MEAEEEMKAIFSNNRRPKIFTCRPTIAPARVLEKPAQTKLRNSIPAVFSPPKRLTVNPLLKDNTFQMLMRQDSAKELR